MDFILESERCRASLLNVFGFLVKVSVMIGLAVGGNCASAATNGSFEYFPDMQSAQAACTASSYISNSCSLGGTVSGMSCMGCGMAGPVAGTGSCQAVERNYISAVPGFCTTLASSNAVAFVYATTACPAGTGLVCATGTDCEPIEAINRSHLNTKSSLVPFFSPPPVNGCLADGSSGPGSTGMSPFLGNPTNVATGAKQWLEEDFSSGEGVPGFVRYYNSQLLESRSGLGYGWTHSHNYRLIYKPNKVVLAQRPDGSSFSFTSIGNGTFTKDPDVELLMTGSSYANIKITTRAGDVENYNSNGLLTSLVTANGQTTTYTYLANTSNVTQVKGPFGHSLTFAWYGSDLRSVTLPNGRILTFTISTLKNLTGVANGDGTTRQYFYENTSLKHALTGISDESALRFATYSYFDTGVVASTSHTGGFGSLYFDGLGGVTDAEGKSKNFSYSTVANLSRLTSGYVRVPNSTTTLPLFSQTFDAASGRVSAIYDGDGRLTQYSHADSTGRITQVTKAGGSTEQQTSALSYIDPWLGGPDITTEPSVYPSGVKTFAVSRTDARFPALPTQEVTSGFTASGVAVSRTVSKSYNTNGQVSQITGPNPVTYGYWSCTSGSKCGQLASITNAAQQSTTLDAYDNAGNLTHMTSPDGVVSTYAYNARGRLTSLTQTAGTTSRSWLSSFDAVGRMVGSSDPDGVAYVYAYDGDSKLTSITDGVGSRLELSYTPMRNLQQIQLRSLSGIVIRSTTQSFDLRDHLNTGNSGSGAASFMYDAGENLLSYTDPKGNAPSTQSFDGLGRLSVKTDSLNGVTHVGYSGSDVVSGITTPNGATWSFEVDDMGDERVEHSPDRGTVNRSFDTAGNMTQQSNARGVNGFYGYDALNRMTSASFSTGESVALGYDTCLGGVGQLCQATDASGTRSFTYDAFGRVATETWTTLGHSFTTQYTWTLGNRLASITYPSGRLVSYVRDSMARISSVASAGTSIVSARSYRADGLLANQTLGNGITEARSYDSQGHLTTMSSTAGASVSMGFSVDANGNVVASSIGGQSDALGYDALDRLTSSSFGTFSYDANGNRLSDSSGWYNYESQSNRLITTPAGSVVLDAAGETLNQPGLTLSYNAFGQLASSSNGSASTIYSYRFDGQRSSKTSGATTTLYHYDTLGRLIAESNEAGIFLVEYFWDDQDRPLAQFSGASKTFLHFDHLGTPRIGTSATGAVVWTWASPAFGNSIPTGSATVNLRLPGQYFDSETGLHQNRFRSYNAVTGRYVQSDPIGVRGGINSFGYVGGNPGRFVDPRGLDASIVLYPGAIVFGHVGIAVNSAQTIGFYPALGTSEINVALGAPNKGEWRLDTRTPIERITIPLSHAQDQVLIDYLSNADRFPGSYQLGSKNCATSVEGALRAVGLNPPNSLRPSGLMNYLRSLYY